MNDTTDLSESELATNLVGGVAAATLLDEYAYGRGALWDPVYSHHRTPRRCPFCGEAYYVHAGFTDHRDHCDNGSNPSANPLGYANGGDDD
ncbi:hypothetical protein [Halorubrum sp. HHNYT27]|uniref:hypothetical protein n=1 Tax=Halorubrum sp. HHNYT27 TaxID=3402275 RepID=UPI003EBA4430